MNLAASRRAAKEAGTTAHRLRLAPSQASRQFANLSNALDFADIDRAAITTSALRMALTSCSPLFVRLGSLLFQQRGKAPDLVFNFRCQLGV
jgi:hypothetical protein